MDLTRTSRRRAQEKLPGRAKVGLRDATHFSDQRVGPTIVDSIIGFTGDDFFNVHAAAALGLLPIAYGVFTTLFTTT